MIILVDMDNTAADLSTAWLGCYNRAFNDTLTPDDLKEYSVMKAAKKCSPESMYKLIEARDFFYELDPLPGVTDALEALRDDGHQVYFVSAAHICRHSYYDKIRWVEKYFPWIGGEKVIFCKEKHLIMGDVLIDDYPANLEKFEGVRILIGKSYNETYDKTKGIIRFSGDQAWAQIADFVLKLGTICRAEEATVMEMSDVF